MEGRGGEGSRWEERRRKVHTKNQWKDSDLRKNSPQIVVPEQLLVKTKKPNKKATKKEKIKGDGIIPTRGGGLALRVPFAHVPHD